MGLKMKNTKFQPVIAANCHFSVKLKATPLNFESQFDFFKTIKNYIWDNYV
jgi:hypothetical protein